MKIKDVTPEIFIPYYGTSLFITPTWDGATVNRIVLNDIYAKKNIGVPVKVWNGSTWVDTTCKIVTNFDLLIFSLRKRKPLRPCARKTFPNNYLA